VGFLQSKNRKEEKVRGSLACLSRKSGLLPWTGLLPLAVLDCHNHVSQFFFIVVFGFLKLIV
jgi:hypothetical protein